MKTAEWIGLDTNVLVFADDSASPNYEKAKDILTQVFKGSLQACLSHQVLAEYFCVITGARLAKNPLAVQDARDRVLLLNKTRRIRKIYPKRSTLKRCIQFCAENDIRGVRVFDALYALTLLDNEVHNLMTQNVQDFKPFKKLALINPFNAA